MNEFDAQLQRLEGKIVWTVFYAPFSAQEAYGTNSRVNVKAVIDGHPFKAVLLPSRNGHYVAFNEAMKAATGKTLGDTVHVSLEQDTEPRFVEVPDEIQEALAGSPGAIAVFSALPDYIKRGDIASILGAKTDATKRKRIDALLDRLASRPE